MKTNKVRDPPKEDDVLVGDGGRTAAGSGVTGDNMRCLKLYQYKHVRGLSVPRAEMPKHFAIGILFGAMRREWFGRKFDTSEATWKHLKKAAQREAELQGWPVNSRDETFSLALMDAYINFWEKKARPIPIAAELELGPVTLVKGGPFNMSRTAKLDDLSKYPEAGGALCIGEAKTTSTDATAVIKEYELHVQPLQYLATYMADPNGEKRFGAVRGVVLDIVVKPEKGRKASFQRVFVEYRTETVAAFIDSAVFHIAAANKIDWDTPAPRSYQCTKMHGRMLVDCDFKDVCRFGRSGAGRFLLPGGIPLRKYKPKPGAEKMPWE